VITSIIEEVTHAYHASSSNLVKNLIAEWEKEIRRIGEEFKMELDEW